jgi:hypothetical protein
MASCGHLWPVRIAKIELVLSRTPSTPAAGPTLFLLIFGDETLLFQKHNHDRLMAEWFIYVLTFPEFFFPGSKIS